MAGCGLVGGLSPSFVSIMGVHRFCPGIVCRNFSFVSRRQLRLRGLCA